MKNDKELISGMLEHENTLTGVIIRVGKIVILPLTGIAYIVKGFFYLGKTLMVRSDSDEDFPATEVRVEKDNSD